MQQICPGDLLGRQVYDDNGTTLGSIKGVHQLRVSGGFEEVTIQDGRGMIFARIDELCPSGTGYVLASGRHRRD